MLYNMALNLGIFPLLAVFLPLLSVIIIQLLKEMKNERERA